MLEEVQDQDPEQREKSTENDEGDTPEVPDFAEPPEDVKFDATTETNSGDPVDDFQAEFEKLVQMDQEWRDHFSQTNTPIRSTTEDEEKRQFMFDSHHRGDFARAASHGAGARHRFDRGGAGHRRAAHRQH